jgi:hypothetical protein
MTKSSVYEPAKTEIHERAFFSWEGLLCSNELTDSLMVPPRSVKLAMYDVILYAIFAFLLPCLPHPNLTSVRNMYLRHHQHIESSQDQ